MTDSRNCEQCGVLFTPRREHARFCSARCRVAWNRLNASDTPAEGGALGWTITAMRETIDRLLRARGRDRPHAFAAAPGSPADILIVIAPGVERFEYFRHLQRIRLGEVTPESLLEVQELYDNHFLRSDAWDGRHA